MANTPACGHLLGIRLQHGVSTGVFLQAIAAQWTRGNARGCWRVTPTPASRHSVTAGESWMRHCLAVTV